MTAIPPRYDPQDPPIGAFLERPGGATAASREGPYRRRAVGAGRRGEGERLGPYCRARREVRPPGSNVRRNGPYPPRSRMISAEPPTVRPRMKVRQLSATAMVSPFEPSELEAGGVAATDGPAVGWLRSIFVGCGTAVGVRAGCDSAD